MKSLAKKHLLKVKAYKPGRPIEEVKRELGLKQAIKLASNENAFPPSVKVISAIKRAAKSINRYPDGGSFYLKKELARRFGLSPDNFIIGNGSDEVIIFAVRTFLKKGDEVIIAKPTFLIYGIAAMVEGIKIKYVPLKDYTYDLEAMKQAVTKNTRMVFIANPDNPTGTYVTKDQVNTFMKGLRRDIIVFFDEAYYEFAKVRRDYPDTLKYMKGGRNVIITRSFSKAYSLAGLRIGYGIASKEGIECLARVREPFNVNSIAQAAALAALKDAAFIKKTRSAIRRGRRFIYSRLDKMGIEYIPSVTNFILLKVGKDAPKIYRKLLRRGIIVRNMQAWGLNNFLRVTIGTMRENKLFIEALRDAI